ncbi:MAG TPA: hypothetical protein VHG89_00625 [Verrucomicrobiae bacterium]|nr:hypothetical protein [Verrucomicrobiae bacterium]
MSDKKRRNFGSSGLFNDWNVVFVGKFRRLVRLLNLALSLLYVKQIAVVTGNQVEQNVIMNCNPPVATFTPQGK